MGGVGVACIDGRLEMMVQEYYFGAISRLDYAPKRTLRPMPIMTTTDKTIVVGITDLLPRKK